MEITVEIFAIGNELCYGRIYDTNSFWIADKVTSLGAKVQQITCITDSIEAICRALGEAIDRNPDFIIMTGGLGPTSDDLTIEALSKLLDLPIMIRQDILQKMAERKQVAVKQLTPNFVSMARSLDGAECLSNPVGWAPVTIIERSKLTISALPGPPSEVKACFEEYLSERIKERTGLQSVSKRVFVTMFESQVSPITEEIMKNTPGTYLKPLVSEYQRDKGFLPIEIIAFSESNQSCQKKIAEITRKLRTLVAQKGGTVKEA